LRAEIDASEKYQCRVVYQKLVDGQSEEAFLDSNFPETGCIAGTCSKKIVDIPVEAPNVRGKKKYFEKKTIKSFSKKNNI